jgi:hypothetical protein
VQAKPETESIDTASGSQINIIINGVHYRAPRPVMTGAELAAVPAELALSRPVPAEGLSVFHLSAAATRIGLPALVYKLDDLPGGETLPRIACRYLNSGLPVTAAGGGHAFVLVGYRRVHPGTDQERIHFIRHDDEVGPYQVVENFLLDDYSPWQYLIVPLSSRTRRCSSDEVSSHAIIDATFAPHARVGYLTPSETTGSSLGPPSVLLVLDRVCRPGPAGGTFQPGRQDQGCCRRGRSLVGRWIQPSTRARSVWLPGNGGVVRPSAAARATRAQTRASKASSLCRQRSNPSPSRFSLESVASSWSRARPRTMAPFFFL